MTIADHQDSMVDSIWAYGVHDTSNVELELPGDINSHSHGLLIDGSHHLIGRVRRDSLVTTISKSHVERFALIVTASVRVVSVKRNTILSCIV
jgi:hypothetical protein